MCNLSVVGTKSPRNQRPNLNKNLVSSRSAVLVLASVDLRLYPETVMETGCRCFVSSLLL